MEQLGSAQYVSFVKNVEQYAEKKVVEKHVNKMVALSISTT